MQKILQCLQILRPRIACGLVAVSVFLPSLVIFATKVAVLPMLPGETAR
ncbi:MAG: hypothetical protein IIW37_02080 [Bacteroidaceae bacterium]|nr:hypothetical protein [Bacteroidaceae bacterium]